MTFAITLIVIGLILLLAMPFFLDTIIKKKSNRKGAKMLSKIFGYLFIIWGAYNLICSLVSTLTGEV